MPYTRTAMWAPHEVGLLLGITLLLLLAAVLGRDQRHEPSARAALVVIAAVVVHLVLPLLRARGVPLPIVRAVAFFDGAVPLAFWWMARVHFDDEFRFRPLHAAVVAVFVAAGSIPGAFPEARYALWPLVPRLLSLAVVAHALVTVHVGAKSDLVVSRLQARHVAVALTGGYIFIELLAEVFLSRALSEEAAAALHAFSAAALIFAVCMVSLRPQPSVVPAARPAAEAPLDPALVERLQHLIEAERVFLEEGLTIAGLAERLAVHEYKVRQLINARLGFKNFNAFLNHYRIREARRILADPAQAHLGVAQVAYDVGYRSLGPFNKAFKERVGQTPTEFRAAAAASAAADVRLPAAKSS